MAMGTLNSAGDLTSAEDVIYYQFRNINSGQCLAIPANSTVRGTQAIQFRCELNDSQLWEMQFQYFDVYANPVYRLRKRGSQNCLAIGNANTTAGQPAIQWPCSAGNEQKWAYDKGLRLHNVGTGKCLAVPRSSLVEGIGLIQWTCSTNSDQQWL
jgi:Ricin-type beta-trefoil lectin domain